MGGHIPTSIFLPIGGSYQHYLEIFAQAGQQAIIVAEEGKEENVCRILQRSGLINIAGYVAGGFDSWNAATGKRDLIIDISIEEFEIDYKFDEFYLIDTRDEVQYELGHVEYAENIPIAEVENSLPDLDASQLYYIYGESADDALFTASLFKRSGFHLLRLINHAYIEIAMSQELKIIKPKKIASPPVDFSAN
jgi:hypothetical protein